MQNIQKKVLTIIVYKISRLPFSTNASFVGGKFSKVVQFFLPLKFFESTIESYNQL